MLNIMSRIEMIKDIKKRKLNEFPHDCPRTQEGEWFMVSYIIACQSSPAVNRKRLSKAVKKVEKLTHF